MCALCGERKNEVLRVAGGGGGGGAGGGREASSEGSLAEATPDTDESAGEPRQHRAKRRHHAPAQPQPQPHHPQRVNRTLFYSDFT